MYSILMMIISAVLVGLVVVSTVKNFLIKFNLSDNGWITVLVVIMILACLFGALNGYVEAYTIRDISNMQESPNMTKAKIDQMKETIPQRMISTNVSLCIAIVAYILQVLMINGIKKNRLKELKANEIARQAKKYEKFD